MRIAPELYLK